MNLKDDFNLQTQHIEIWVTFNVIASQLRQFMCFPEAKINFNVLPSYILRTEYVSGITGCHFLSLDVTNLVFVSQSCFAQATPLLR